MTTGVRNPILILSAIALLLCACHRRETRAGGTAQNPATQTIAPAEARPAPTGTDAMTQTVEVEDSRSEEDGGSSAAPPATTAKPAPKPPAKKKH